MKDKTLLQKEKKNAESQINISSAYPPLHLKFSPHLFAELPGLKKSRVEVIGEGCPQPGPNILLSKLE